MTTSTIRVAIFIHASTETREGTMRIVNALITAKEFIDAGDHVDIIFDGAGVRTAVEISDPSHQIYPAFKQVEAHVTGICRFCAGQLGLIKAVQTAGYATLADNHQHPSYRNFLKNGYEILNF